MLQRDTQQRDVTPAKTVEHRGMDMDLEKEELEALLEEVLGLYSGNYT
jgi:hypothetical protein